MNNKRLLMLLHMGQQRPEMWTRGIMLKDGKSCKIGYVLSNHLGIDVLGPDYRWHVACDAIELQYDISAKQASRMLKLNDDSQDAIAAQQLIEEYVRGL